MKRRVRIVYFYCLFCLRKSLSTSLPSNLSLISVLYLCASTLSFAISSQLVTFRPFAASSHKIPPAVLTLYENSKNLPQYHIYRCRNLFPPSRIPNTKELATCAENAISSKCEPGEEVHFWIGRLRPQQEIGDCQFKSEFNI